MYVCIHDTSASTIPAHICDLCICNATFKSKDLRRDLRVEVPPQSPPHLPSPRRPANPNLRGDVRIEVPSKSPPHLPSLTRPFDPAAHYPIIHPSEIDSAVYWQVASESPSALASIPAPPSDSDPAVCKSGEGAPRSHWKRLVPGRRTCSVASEKLTSCRH